MLGIITEAKSVEDKKLEALNYMLKELGYPMGLNDFKLLSGIKNHYLSFFEDEIFERDPTPDKGYLLFLVKMYIFCGKVIPNENMERYIYLKNLYASSTGEKKEEIKNLLNYEYKGKRYDFIDINKLNFVKGNDDIYNAFMEMTSKIERKGEQVERERMSIYDVYEDDKIKVLIPLTFEASRYWGSKYKWCISVDEASWYIYVHSFYNNYIINPKFIIDKTKSEGNPFHRVSFTIFNDNFDDRIIDRVMADMDAFFYKSKTEGVEFVMSGGGRSLNVKLVTPTNFNFSASDFFMRFGGVYKRVEVYDFNNKLFSPHLYLRYLREKIGVSEDVIQNKILKFYDNVKYNTKEVRDSEFSRPRHSDKRPGWYYGYNKDYLFGD